MHLQSDRPSNKQVNTLPFSANFPFEIHRALRRNIVEIRRLFIYLESLRLPSCDKAVAEYHNDHERVTSPTHHSLNRMLSLAYFT